MKKKMFKIVFFLLGISSIAYCCECEDDPNKVSMFDIFEFEGHLWQPSFCFKHSDECPCLYEKDENDFIE